VPTCGWLTAMSFEESSCSTQQEQLAPSNVGSSRMGRCFYELGGRRTLCASRRAQSGSRASGAVKPVSVDGYAPIW
jgi:hypothetical protein